MDENKSIKQFLATLALFVWGFVAIITSASVWNAALGAFRGIVAGVALAIHAACIIYVARKLIKEGKL